jgi:hypothetical protein
MESGDNCELIVQHPSGCRMCGEALKNEYSVFVSSIERHEAAGWHVRGSGWVSCDCPQCCAMYQAVRRGIPIECEGFDCPKCGLSQALTYNVQRIDAHGSEFSFEATISCGTCHKKRTFVRILKNLLKLKKIEIKLTGISLER